MKHFLVLGLALAACGGGGGSSDGNNMMADAPGMSMTFTISGTATSRGIGGATPETGVAIAAFANSDENTALAMTTTDAQGNFSLMITSTGALDGFLKATKSGFTTSYLYPPRPVSTDLAMVPMNMLTTSNFGTLSTLAQANQMAGKGVIGMIVLSGAELTSAPVAGATITTSPASMPYRYNGGSGLPSSSATATAADGLAYAFNAPVGAITASANKSGSTFQSTTLNVHADALTQTIITP